MVAHWCQVVGVTFDHGSHRDAAFPVTGDAVVVAFREFGGVDEEALFHGREVAARVQHFGEEADCAFLEVANHPAQRALPVQGEQFLDAIQGRPRLLDGLYAAH